MKSRTRSLLFVFLILASMDSQGQSWDSVRSGFRILTKPSELLLRNPQISFEKVRNRFNYGLTLGYRPSFQKGGEMNGGGYGLGFSYANANWSNGLYEAISLEGNGKWYQKSNPFFFEMVLFYRFWWFDNKRASYSNVESPYYDFDGIRSERVKVVGCKLLVGYTIDFLEIEKWSGTLDLFGGIGIRNRDLVYKTRQAKPDGSFSPAAIYRDSYWFPSFQFGCKLGIQKRSKN